MQQQPVPDGFNAGLDIFSYLNSVLEGMSILQTQMTTLTSSNKAAQLVIQCRMVEMENRLMEGRAADLVKLLDQLSKIVPSAPAEATLNFPPACPSPTLHGGGHALSLCPTCGKNTFSRQLEAMPADFASPSPGNVLATRPAGHETTDVRRASTASKHTADGTDVQPFDDGAEGGSCIGATVDASPLFAFRFSVAPNPQTSTASRTPKARKRVSTN